MDGVIAHTNPFHTEAFKVFFDRHDVHYTSGEFEEHMYGKHNSYIMSYFFKRPIAGDELMAYEAEKEGLFREIYENQVQPMPGFLEFLGELKVAGFKTGVATSAPRENLDLIMIALGFDPMMESILSSQDVSAHKPHPEVYLKSLANLGVSPKNSVIFEDSFSGVSAGVNAGVNVVGVLSSHKTNELPGCVYYIDDFNAIDVTVVNQIIEGTIG